MDLPQLKSRFSIASVLSHYCLAVDRNKMLRCPFHEDKTPSMQVSGEAVYCHSTNCARHGKHIDVIDFVMYKEGDCLDTEHSQRARQYLVSAFACPLKSRFGS